MSKIKSSNGFRNKYQEPSFIIKDDSNNGVISNEHFFLYEKSELHRLLDEGLDACKLNAGRPAEEVFAELDEIYKEV